MFEIVATSLMIAMLAVAVVTDLRSGKIYNKLTVPCAAAGLTLGGVAGGAAGLGDHALGAGIALGAVLMLSAVAGLGGGDAKLLIAVGALKGFHFTIWAMLLTGVFGGVLAAVWMIRRRAVRATAVNMLTNLLANAGGVHTDLATGSALGKIPYSIAIALGSLAALALGA
ncbi:MAG: prepilin peptidase [Armatimonadota bacterium]|nr:MAG: prepilin peptidase [Armatimonadota bacterium]